LAILFIAGGLAIGGDLAWEFSSVLDQTKNPTLVLTTCNPRYSAAERLIVIARRLS
jgi:sortase (surface protein transpeptidase)